MQAVVKILQAKVGELSSNFCKQFELRSDFASTFKWDHLIPISNHVKHELCGGGGLGVGGDVKMQETAHSCLNCIGDAFHSTKHFGTFERGAKVQRFCC